MANGLVTLILLVASTVTFASNKTICGRDDDRVSSFNNKIARVGKIGKHAGCTATMISKSCAITAGHCMLSLQVGEFNTPPSRGGEPQASSPEDTYEININSIVGKDDGPGKDWAVFKFERNVITGNYPGDVQGTYTIATKKPYKGDRVTITGFGLDRSDDIRNLTQQTNTGKVYSTRGKILKHRIDTMGGNSGSSIILESSNEIVGIHTHGGCRSTGGSNQSTLIATHKMLKAAIKACLNSDM